MEYDNPAARLLAILEAGKTVPMNGNCRNTWHNILKTDRDEAILLSRLGKLMELPGQIQQAIKEEFPSHLKNLAHWQGQVSRAFMSQNLAGTWDSFFSHIDVHTTNYLSLTSELLQTKANTKLMADDEILSLRGRIDGLYKEILEGNLPPEIRSYLLRYLRKIVVSIDEYFISGALPVMEATNTLLGHAFMDEKYRCFLRDEEIGKRVLDCLSAMANVVAVAIGLPQLSAMLPLLASGR